MAEFNSIYVGGISCQLSECSIHEQLHTMFSKYGTVFRIRLSTKCVEISGLLFAHVQLLCTPEKLRECLITYKKCIWKGKRIIVERAKPTYIQKYHSRKQGNGVVSTTRVELPSRDEQSVLYIEGKERNSIFVVEPKPSKMRRKFQDVEQNNEKLHTSKRMEDGCGEDLDTSGFLGFKYSDNEDCSSKVVSLQENRSKVLHSKNNLGAERISKSFFRE